MTEAALPESDLQLLVVAENLLTRIGLASVLEERGCMVLAQTDGAALNREIDHFQPDMLVVDMGWHSRAMSLKLGDVDRDLPLLALVAEHEDDDALLPLLGSLTAFACYGMLLRDSAPDAIVAALQAIDSGLVVFDPSLSQLLRKPVYPQPSPAAASLTPRENEVLQLLAQGLTNKAIALALGVTEHTVKFHVNAIMGKLDAQSRTEAVVRATRLGLIVL